MNKIVTAAGVALGLWWLSRKLNEPSVDEQRADVRTLALRVAATLEEGATFYSRDLVRQLQRALGLHETGLYDSTTRTALILQGLDDAMLPPPFVTVVDETEARRMYGAAPA